MDGEQLCFELTSYKGKYFADHVRNDPEVRLFYWFYFLFKCPQYTVIVWEKYFNVPLFQGHFATVEFHNHAVVIIGLEPVFLFKLPLKIVCKAIHNVQVLWLWCLVGQKRIRWTNPALGDACKAMPIQISTNCPSIDYRWAIIQPHKYSQFM